MLSIVTMRSVGGVWSAYDEDESTITGSPSLAQAAINTAFKPLGQRSADLWVIGADDGPPGGALQWDPASSLSFPVAHGKTALLHSISSPALIFDSWMMGAFQALGCQIYGVTHAPQGNSELSIPGNPTINATQDSEFSYGSVVGQFLVQWPVGSMGMTHSKHTLNELACNGHTVGLQIQSPTSGVNFTGKNEISVNHGHSVATGGTFFQIGTGAPVAGQAFGRNQYNLHAAAPTGAETAFETWASDDKISLTLAGFTTGTSIHFHAGALGNIVFLSTDQDTPIIQDDNGAASTNLVFCNGRLLTPLSMTLVGSGGLTIKTSSDWAAVRLQTALRNLWLAAIPNDLGTDSDLAFGFGLTPGSNKFLTLKSTGEVRLEAAQYKVAGTLRTDSNGNLFVVP